MKKTDPSITTPAAQRGDGTFEDVTARAGLTGENLGYSFGVAAGDYDNDGYTDSSSATPGATRSITTTATARLPM